VVSGPLSPDHGKALSRPRPRGGSYTAEPSKPKLLNRYHTVEVSLIQIQIDELTPAADGRDRGGFDRSFDSVGGGDSKSKSNV
jgi:hypothetical protein